MWHNDGTGWDVVDDIVYSTNFYTRRAVDLIQAHDPKQPFYLHLTHQAVHSPWEEPPLSQQIPNGSVWWDQTWGSMLNVLDKGIANVTNALRAKGMWESTLIVLVSDNGGDHGVSPSDPTGRTTMANNWPFRGTKLTAWEGGTRVAAVVGGGFVPTRLRGSSSDVVMHMADWYPTLANLAGAITNDPAVVNGSVHDVDGVNMWPAITGANISSPRPWLPVTEGSILWQQPGGSLFKFITDARRARLFTPNGSMWNDTTPHGWNGTHVVECVWVSPTDPDICAVCDPIHPCLFELKSDPGEAHNLASDPARASTMATMKAKLASYVVYVDGNMTAAELQGYDCPDMNPMGSESLWGTYAGPCCTPKVF
jgi:arylsulfatase A-like enzyme|tara:strand:- start:177 stop:1277 length:1101 start_codon:yes stop_codon:yes gene_type:complete